MDLGCITLSEIGQTEKDKYYDKYYDLTSMWNLKKIKKKTKFIDIPNRLVVARDRELGGG